MAPAPRRVDANGALGQFGNVANKLDVGKGWMLEHPMRSIRIVHYEIKGDNETIISQLFDYLGYCWSDDGARRGGGGEFPLASFLQAISLDSLS